MCLLCVLTVTSYCSQSRGMSWFGLSLGWCRARRITVMDWGPVVNTCVNTVCLFPEPCALGVGSVFFFFERERVKLDGCISHCAGGGGEPLNAQREECSSERQQDTACPWNICGPVPRLTRWGWDLFVSGSLSQLAHHRQTSPKSYRWGKSVGL